MSEENKTLPIKRHYHLMITAPGQAKVLLLPGPSGWELPGWTASQLGRQETVDIIRKAHELTGLETTVLMCYYFELESAVVAENEKPKLKETIKFFALESRAPGQSLPSGAIWASRTELAELELAQSAHRAILDQWLFEIESGQTPAMRVAWAQPGWFNRASGWITAELKTRGWAITGPIEQLKANVISTILRVPTEVGPLYFKAVPPYFASEPVFGRLLAELHPNHVPPILAASAEDGWILMSDFNGSPLDEATDLDHWCEALAFYARMQIESIPEAEALLAAGVRDRRLNILGAQMEALFADTSLMLPGDPLFGLTQTEISQVRALLPELKTRCERLRAYNLPETIDHGDFHSFNVAVTPNGYIIYDWSDLTITHPFFSLLPMFDWNTQFDHIPGWREKLRDAYLQPWTIYEPMDRLIEAFEISHPLSIVVQILNYQWIVDSSEPKARWEHNWFIPEMYQMLLKSFE